MANNYYFMIKTMKNAIFFKGLINIVNELY